MRHRPGLALPLIVAVVTFNALPALLRLVLAETEMKSPTEGWEVVTIWSEARRLS